MEVLVICRRMFGQRSLSWKTSLLLWTRWKLGGGRTCDKMSAQDKTWKKMKEVNLCFRIYSKCFGDRYGFSGWSLRAQSGQTWKNHRRLNGNALQHRIASKSSRYGMVWPGWGRMTAEYQLSISWVWECMSMAPWGSIRDCCRISCRVVTRSVTTNPSPRFFRSKIA